MLYGLGEQAAALDAVALVVEQYHVMQIGGDCLEGMTGLPAPREFVGIRSNHTQELSDQRVLGGVLIYQENADCLVADST